MFSNGIIINWENADEFIKIDFQNLDKLNSISDTKEWWDENKKFVDYKTVSEIEKNKDNSITVKLTYLHEINPDFGEEDAPWGTSTFTIHKDKYSGRAEWEDLNYPENNGSCQWFRVDTALFDDRDTVLVHRKVRKQAKFRAQLLQRDKKCVISGESTTESLEAAHIIPVAVGGSESLNNGIILRSDIHKLYDSGMFVISEQGNIEEIQHGELSESYIELLNKAKIPKNALSQIMKNLSLKQELALQAS